MLTMIQILCGVTTLVLVAILAYRFINKNILEHH